MQLPMPAPSFHELLASADPNRLAQVLTAAEPDSYLHWDDLRRHEPPPGLSHEEWWLGLKVGRRAQYRTLPLLATDGSPFVYMLPDEALRMIQHIERFCSGILDVPGGTATRGHRDAYVMTSLVEEAITSSQLEGASTTRKAAKQMLLEDREPRTSGERMILNNFHAMQHVSSLRDEAISERGVLDLHRIVTAGTMRDPSLEGSLQAPDDERVKVYAPGNDLLLHDPPPATELPERFTRMVEFANHDPEHYLPPVVKAIVLHFWLGYDHPFDDGNGRTARALFYWCLLREGYWLAEYLTISRILRGAPSKYARSFLLTESDDNDLTHFVLHHLRVICRAIDDLREHIASKTTELRNVHSLLRGDDRFNHRQVTLIGHALRHPEERYTIANHMRHHGVVYDTARTDLLGLADHGLIVKHQAGKAFVFVAATNLTERLTGET